MIAEAEVAARSEAMDGLVSLTVGGQSFGVPVLKVQDVITQTAIHKVPLAPRDVAGSLNLRGRIVTALDMRVRLSLPPREPGETFMCVIVEHESELYALLVDDVGDVLWLQPTDCQPVPITMPGHHRAVCSGLYALEGELLLLLSVEKILALNGAAGQVQ